MTQTFEKQKEKFLLDVKADYKKALELVKAKDFPKAENLLQKILKPFLSNPAKKNPYVEIEDFALELLDSMYNLGLIYLEDKEKLYTNSYAKAASIFNYCHYFKEKYKVISDKRDYLQESLKAEALFIKSSGISDKKPSKEEYTKYKAELESFRQNIKTKLADKHHVEKPVQEKTKEVEEIYSESTSFFVSDKDDGLVQRLLKSCMDILGDAPCTYTIIGLGSIASGKYTPWSDFEFAILTEHSKYKDSPNSNVIDYFRNLTKLLHMKIINLGETPLRYMGIESLNDFQSGQRNDDWFWDEVMEFGLRFDSFAWQGCKSPLGRQSKEHKGYIVKDSSYDQEEVKRDFELILTPEEMVHFQREDKEFGNLWYDSDKHLVQSLRSTSYIAGSQEILDKYRAELSKFDKENPLIPIKRSLELMSENLEDFSLKLSSEEEGKLFNLKYTIFRIADRIIIELGNYYSVQPKEGEKFLTSWQVIDRLYQNGKLTKKGSENLKAALSIATALRMKAYSHNEGQKDSLSTYEPAMDHLDESKRKELIEETFYLKDISLLQYFYKVMFRVQKIAKKLCNGEGEDEFSKDDLFDNSDYLKGMIHARFLEYREAIASLEKAKEVDSTDLRIIQALQFLYDKLSVNRKAIEIGKEALALNLRLHEGNHPDIATAYDNLGDAYSRNGQDSEALKCYKMELKIEKSLKPPNHPDIASALARVATSYRQMSNFQEALKYHKESLDMTLEYYKSDLESDVVARSYGSYGEILFEYGKYQEAKAHFLKARDILSKYYKDNPNHPALATIYSNLGDVCLRMRDDEEALKMQMKALNIMKVCYRSNPYHHEIGGSYTSIGNYYFKKNNFDEALKNYNKAHKIYLVAFEHNPNNIILGQSYHNIGNTYCQLGILDIKNYEVAIKNFSEAIEIKKAAFGNENNISIAKSYTSLAIAYKCTGRIDEAEAQFLKSIEIRKIIFDGDETNPSFGITFHNLADLYLKKNNISEVVKYYSKLLKITAIYEEMEYLKAHAVAALYNIYKSQLDAKGIEKSHDIAKMKLAGDNEFYKEEYKNAISCYDVAMNLMRDQGTEAITHPLFAEMKFSRMDVLHNVAFPLLGNIFKSGLDIVDDV